MIWVNGFSEGVVPHVPSLALDSSGNVYIGGVNSPGQGLPYYAIINYDLNGNVLWTTRYGADLWTGATNLVVDSSGNVYIAINSGYSGDFVTIKYSKSASPQPPTALTASDIPCDNGGSVSLNWTLSSDDPTSGTGNNKVTGYNIYRALTFDGPYEVIGAVAAGVPNFIDSSANTATTYYYVVRATNGSKESSDSNVASAASNRNLPLPPATISATDTPYDLGGSITLAWTKSLDDGAGLNNVASYTIYRYSVANGNIFSLTSLPAGVAGYIDATTVDTDTYYYFIKAYDTQCNTESDASNIATGSSVNNFSTLGSYIETLPGASTEVFNSLTSQVENAVASFESGNTQAAINKLDATLNEISAQSGKKIDVDTAAILTEYIQNLINNIK